MPYSIATDTISRINDLGRLIRDFDDARDIAQKQAYLQLAFDKACKVLVELATPEEELITAIDSLGDPISSETLKKCSEMFWRLEELVLRDAGIDGLTREKILVEAKHFQNIVERNDLPAKGRSIAFDIRTAGDHICNRQNNIELRQSRSAIGTTLAAALGPINAAVSFTLPFLVPAVFASSAKFGGAAAAAIKRLQ